MTYCVRTDWSTIVVLGLWHSQNGNISSNLLPPGDPLLDTHDASLLSHSASSSFPMDFVWGAATSSYQIEGATHEGGRGPTVWDAFVARQPSPIMDNTTGDIACDHFHRVEQDVALMKDVNLTAYRFSLAWSRILPQGDLAGGINEAAVAFYNFLIDTLLRNGIVPFVTLFHWDTPQALEDRYGGWRSSRTADIFANDYARTAFAAFGDRVQNWITLNEPWTVAVNGYSTGMHAPGRQSGTEPYFVAHNLLLAHAKATLVYRRHFQMAQKGVIGISNCGDFRYPAHLDDMGDVDAAERAMLFQFGWFVDPLFFGDYPKVMRERLGDRLPSVSHSERQLFMEASADFLGLNYYSAFLASTPELEADYIGYWADINVKFTDRLAWRKNAMGWNVVPDGLREMLLWVSNRYNNPRILITENGSAEYEPDLKAALDDEERRDFLEHHLHACSQAIDEGVNLGGYFAWSLLDNFGKCKVRPRADFSHMGSSCLVLPKNGNSDTKGGLESIMSISTHSSGRPNHLLCSIEPQSMPMGGTW
jgi:beta-glucosidase/6-phospho-beta-glucosidase/beta-galactosidase